MTAIKLYRKAYVQIKATKHTGWKDRERNIRGTINKE